MADRGHPDDDVLLASALGTAPDGARDRVLAHVSECAGCRGAHRELIDAIDLTLPAVPRAQPSTGFEGRVLERLDAARSGAPPVRPGARHRSGWLAVAAAGLLGVALGAAGVSVLSEQPPPQAPAVVPASAVPLVDEDGADVGSVARTRDATGDRLVVVVNEDAPAGVYTCRVTLADGTAREVGRWPLSRYGESAWVIDEPAPGVRSVELLTGPGAVWATAGL